MKKWILALSLIGCSLLFFVSGSFLGYLTLEQKAKETAPHKKPLRKPSGQIIPIFGRVVQNQNVTLMDKGRSPTPTAVMRAQQYKGQYFDRK